MLDGLAELVHAKAFFLWTDKWNEMQMQGHLGGNK